MPSSVMLTYLKFSNPVTIVLLIAVGFVLFRRRLYRDLPWFTTYIVYVAVYTFTTYSIDHLSHNPFLKFYWYWGGNVINQCIAFMVIIEVFRNCVREHDSIRKIGITILVLMAILAVVVAVFLAPYGSQFDNSGVLRQMAHSMLVLQRSIRVVQVCLLVAIFAFSSYLALSWRNYNFGIALGYGLYASLNLVAFVAWEYFGARWNLFGANFVILIDSFAYKLTLILWMTYLWRADRGQINQLPPSSSTDLDEWNEALKPLAK